MAKVAATRSVISTFVDIQSYSPRKEADFDWAAHFESVRQSARATVGPPSRDIASGASQGDFGDVDGVPFKYAESTVPLKNFDEFYAAHRMRLFALVRKVVREYWYDVSIDPQDIVQDTMEVAIRNWPRIGRMAHPDKYLRRVAAKLALRAMEKSSREVSTSAEGFLTLFDNSLASGSERSPEEMVTADLVRDVLKSLPRRQAQVLLLTADGWSDSAIGKSLDMAPATVRSHRRHMKKVFAERLPHDRSAGLLGIAA